MNTKLTLSIDKEIIEKAKYYAKQHNVSLSFLIQNYLQKVIAEISSSKSKKGSIVDELSGILSLDDSIGYRNIHTDYLNEKYM